MSDHRDLAAEARDTERAISLWQQRASSGRLPRLADFGVHRLSTDWGNRFLISGDQHLDAAVFIAYGMPFARLLGLPDKPDPRTSILRQLPPRYRDLFIEGCTEALLQTEPARLSGALPYEGKNELYRAVFLPVQGTPGAPPLIFGSFNHRVVADDYAVDTFRTVSNWLDARAREARPIRG